MVRIEMTPPARIRFRAVSEAGDPVTSIKANVWALDPATGIPLVGFSAVNPRTAVDGWFEMQMFPSPADHDLAVTGTADFTRVELPLVEGGTVETLDPVIVLGPMSIEGRVVDPAGNPIEGALILDPFDPNFSVWSGTPFYTGPDGSFRFTGVWPGRVAAFPPADRPDVGAGSLTPGGLAGWDWPDGVRHISTDIVLPYGHWYPSTADRTAPTETQPVSATTTSAEPTAGVNVVKVSFADQGPWSSTGYEVQVRFSASALLDIHPSLTPGAGRVPGLAPAGSPVLGCTTELTCAAYRSVGPYGDQIVIPGDDAFLGRWLLYSGADNAALLLDPPLVFGPYSYTADRYVDVSTATGCTGSLVSQVSAIEEYKPEDFITRTFYDIPSMAPGTVTFDGWDGRYRLRLSVGATSGVVVHDVWYMNETPRQRGRTENWWTAPNYVYASNHDNDHHHLHHDIDHCYNVDDCSGVDDHNNDVRSASWHHNDIDVDHSATRRYDHLQHISARYDHDFDHGPADHDHDHDFDNCISLWWVLRGT